MAVFTLAKQIESGRGDISPLRYKCRHMQNISPLVSSVTASKLPLVTVGSYTLLNFFSLVSLFKNKFGDFILIPLINLCCIVKVALLSLFSV